MAGLSSSSIKLIASLFAGSSAVAVGGGYLIKDDTGRPIIQSLISAQPETTAEQPVEDGAKVAALPPEQEPAAAPEPQEEPVAKQPELPVFDLLRVEPDGSVVIAGRGPSDSEIAIMENGEVVAKGKSGPGGDFAIVFDNPLSPGPHELFIRATPLDEDGKQGEALLSAEAGIVTIPEVGDENEEVLAMVQEPGEATRVLQQSEPAEPVEEAAIEETPEVEPVEPEPEKEPAPMAEIAVKAVDVEQEKVFIAGTGEPGTRVRIYINDAFKGDVKINPFGNYLLELDEGLQAGSHDLRVDMLDDTGDVVSRVAVVIDHEQEEAAPKAVEVAKAEPQPEPVSEPEPETEKTEPADTAAVTMETEIVKPEAPRVAESEPVAEKPEVIKTGRSVIIRKGDSLWRISRRMLGQGRKYTTIFSANANKIKDPNKIYPGQVFDVPDDDEVAGQANNQG